MEKKFNKPCQNEEWFGLICEHVNDGIIIADPQKNFHYCNKYMCNLLGYTFDEVTRLRVDDIHFPDDLPLIYDRFDRLGKGSITVAREVAVKRKDGSFFFADITGGAFTYKGAEYRTGVFRDVSEQKEIEDELKKTKLMLQLVLDNIPQRVFWKDRDSVYLGCNAGFAEDVDIQRPFEIQGKTDDDFPYLSKHVANWRTADREVIYEKKRLSSTYAVYKNTRAGTKKIWIKEIKLPLPDVDGNVVGVLGTYEDITKDVIREDMVRRLSHRVMQAQEDERSRIARELHDELGQKISAVSLYLDSIRQEIPAHMDAVCLRASSILRETAETIRTMLHRLRPELLDELGLIKAMKWYRDTYSEDGEGPVIAIRAENVCDVTEPGARLALYRIFQESVTNSIKHAAARHVTVSLSFKKNRVCMVVRDDGCGFDAAAVYNEGMSNCGIGLVSMQERASALGGEVTITSDLDKGTTVYACLPLERNYIK